MNSYFKIPTPRLQSPTPRLQSVTPRELRARRGAKYFPLCVRHLHPAVDAPRLFGGSTTLGREGG